MGSRRNVWTITGAFILIVMLCISIPAAILGGIAAYASVGSGYSIALAVGRIFGYPVQPLKFSALMPVRYLVITIQSVWDWIFDRHAP